MKLRNATRSSSMLWSMSTERNGDSENAAHLKVQNALLPLYKKEPSKVLLEYLQWMQAIKKDYTFQKVMGTQKDLKDTDGFDWLESTKLAIDCLRSNPFHKTKTYFDCDTVFCSQFKCVSFKTVCI